MTNELEEAVKASDIYKGSTTLEMHGPQAALLYLLAKLDVIGMRRISQNHILTMVGQPLPPPPCSIACAVISLSRDYIQFCPKRMADKDLRVL